MPSFLVLLSNENSSVNRPTHDALVIVDVEVLLMLVAYNSTTVPSISKVIIQHEVILCH